MSKSLYFSLVLLAASSALSAQTYTVLYNFADLSGPKNPGMIAQGRDGAMLSSSHNADSDKAGVAFRIWPNGSFQELPLTEGEADSGLILATDGQFYGTTQFGVAADSGTVFKISPDGTNTTLHVFTGGTDGANPVSGPIQSIEGDFYGTTLYGSVYRITKFGAFTLLHTLSSSDGNPETPLVQGTDYYFYGSTGSGGPYGRGIIYRVSRSGRFKVLVNFNGTNGATPYSGLVQANDGNFYGVTYNGGSSNLGVLFRMKPDGTLTVLHSFSGGSDGSSPVGGIVQGSDGNLYGTTVGGGKYGSGVIFRASLAGDLVAIHDFDGATGGAQLSAIFQHTNGRLYGAAGGGTFGQGVFYSLDAHLPPFVTYLPTYGRAGALVQILGQGFTSGSQVLFNGTPAASPVVVYPTYLRVIVPSGATTGPITVTTATSTLTSNKVFVVHPH